MLSEKDKKALLNGAYGISRNGYKCKFINLIDSDGTTQSGFGKNIPRSDFERIPYFGAEAHAKAWFDAMQDSRNT